MLDPLGRESDDFSSSTAVGWRGLGVGKEGIGSWAAGRTRLMIELHSYSVVLDR